MFEKETHEVTVIVPQTIVPETGLKLTLFMYTQNQTDNLICLHFGYVHISVYGCIDP